MCSDHRQHHAQQDSKEASKKKQGRSIGERIAEFGLYAIFVFGDVYTLWENHRIVALVIAVAGLGFLLVLDKGFSRKTIARTLVGASIVAIAAYFIGPENFVPNVEVTGTLQPANDPTPRNYCDNPEHPADMIPLPKNTLKILIGTNTWAWTKPIRFTPIVIGDCPTVTMLRTSTGIEVGADLFDANGKLIARVRKNAISAIQGEHSSVTRDGDLSTLIIRDQDKREILYIRYLNPFTLRMRGIFGCHGHALVAIKDNEPIPGMIATENCFFEDTPFRIR